MAAYGAAPDLLAVTRRIGSLQLERSVLAASAQSYAARAHADEVERELLMLENALDTVAMMLGDTLDESDDSEKSEDESAAATPPLPRGVRRELENHMSRVQQLAGERDVLEAAIAATPAGAAKQSSQRRLAAVEAELTELERTLDELAREFGGEDGPLAWALSKRAGKGDGVEASRVLDTSNCTDSDDSDEWLAARVRSTRSSVLIPAQTHTNAPPARRADGGYARRGGGWNDAVGRRAPPQTAASKRAEARAHTRALLEGGLGHAMKGVRPSR